MGEYERVLSQCYFYRGHILKVIFITVGTQKIQFDRLLLLVDRLIEEKIIKKEDVFAQTGYSNYLPKNYNYKKFLDEEDIEKLFDQAEFIITHAGTGSIINCLKREKKVIVFPRDSTYGEHVDNHQYQIADNFSALGYCLKAVDYESLKNSVLQIRKLNFAKFKSNNDVFFSELLKIITEN